MIQKTDAMGRVAAALGREGAHMAAAAGDEAAARAYFARWCEEGAQGCPKCGEGKNYGLKDGRLRCSRCGYTFHAFSLRWINRGGLAFAHWMTLVGHFAEGLPAQRIALRMPLTYNTIHKALTTLRLAILAQDTADAAYLLNEKNELGVFCSGGADRSPYEHCAACSSPVFSIREGGGAVDTSVARDLLAREVMAYPVAVNMCRTFLYTDTFAGHDSLLFSCCKTVRRLYRGDPVRQLETVHLDRDSAFWRFAKPWLAQYHAIAPETYPLYLKEIAFRYNHRGDDIAPLFAQRLCALVPHR
ncbi:MAG: transposase [Desulfovibrionaceae bacterium]